MSNKSKKNLIVFLITSIIILLVVLCTLAFLIQTTKESTNPVIEQKTSTPKQNYEYMLKDINAKINVFKKGTEAPVDILEKGTNILPSYDRELLSQGIYIENIEELNKILEDYDD